MKRKTKEEFITQAIEKHGNKYTYKHTVYVNDYTKVTITCRVHGDFLQRPGDHIKGSGCRECAGNKPMTTDIFIAKAKEVHGNKYDYSKVTYINNKTPVKIKCKIHGEFMQAPSCHIITKQGCKKCGYVTVTNKQTYTTDIFIKKANKVHKNKYKYPNTVYISHDKPVAIECKQHGEFLQKPAYHLGGSNCPKCSKEVCRFQFKADKETTLYYIYLVDFDLYKIGITTKSIKKRFSGDKLNYTVLATKVFKTGYAAWKVEQNIIKKYIEFSYDGPSILHAGNSELFTCNILPKGLK